MTNRKTILFRVHVFIFISVALAGLITVFLLTGDGFASIRENTFLFVLIIVGMVFAIIIGVNVILRKLIFEPLNKVYLTFEKIASGDYNAEITGASDDEIGRFLNQLTKVTTVLKRQVKLLDNIPTPIMSIDKDFNIEYINSAGANLLNVPKEKLIGDKCYHHFKTDHCQTENCALKKAMNNDRKESATTISRAGGGERHIMYTGIPVKEKDHKIVGALEFVADISEIKNFENYLSQSTEIMVYAMEKLEHGELDISLDLKDHKGSIYVLFQKFNNVVATFNKMIADIKSSVEFTAGAGMQILSSTEEVAAGAQEQSSQANEIASAVEQMAATIIQTSKNASEAAEYANQAGVLAAEGGKVVENTIEGMQRIAEVVENSTETIKKLGRSSAQIGEIIQVIDEIADQTNLLALNAAIEAARAGEHGRGFAVVADEVRKLAERTTKATNEIAEMIKHIQADTEGAVSAITEGNLEAEKGYSLATQAGEALRKIIEASQKVVDEVTQVASASEEQSSVAEEISVNIEGIRSVADQAASNIMQISNAADELNNLTTDLKKLVGQFKLHNEIDQNKIIAADSLF